LVALLREGVGSVLAVALICRSVSALVERKLMIWTITVLIKVSALMPAAIHAATTVGSIGGT
jgi:hypothetical protein